MIFREKRRFILAFLIAALAISCNVPESERMPGVFQMNPSSTTINALQTQVAFTVQCDLHWTVALKDASLGEIQIISEKEGSGGSFLITFQPNLNEEEREHVVILKAGKGELTQTIVQGGLSTFISPRSLHLHSTLEAAASFTAPDAWSARILEGEDWMEIKTPSGEKGSAVLTVAPLDANENLGSREGLIELTVGGHSFTVSVTQDQQDVVLLDGDTSLNFSFEEQSFQVKTLYNSAYQVKSSADWIIYNSVKAPLLEGLESFTLQENPTTEARSAQVTFSLEGQSSESAVVLTVNQGGKDPVLVVTQPGFYGIDGTNYTLGAQGWNQFSSLAQTGGSYRYRLLNGSTLSCVELNGASAEDKLGVPHQLHLTLQTQGYTTLVKDFQAVLLYRKNGLAWYKESADTYFVVKQ